MRANLVALFVLLAALWGACRGQDDEEDDYSGEDIHQKVANLRLEGAEYLQKVMKQLQNDRTNTLTVQVPYPSTAALYTHRLYSLDHHPENYVTPVYNISGPTPVPDLDAEVVHKAPPPISLSKEELLALYEAALGKVSQLKGGSQIPEEVQHTPVLSQVPGTLVYCRGVKLKMRPEKNIPVAQPVYPTQRVKPAAQGQMASPVSGYYYYYFPITSFLKPSPKPPSAVAAATPAPQQLHATITMMESPNNKSMEPLFMAISGFIGMALMFFFSVLFVPKFGKIRSKNAQFKDTPDEMANFAQILLEVMAGRDCGERLACEIVRIFRGIKSNNKPLRVLEIILPPNLSQQVLLIRKSAGKKAKCEYIPCKMKKLKPPPSKPQKPKIVPWKKKQTPHDLWMKHFEKGKRETKQQQQSKNAAGSRKPPSRGT